MNNESIRFLILIATYMVGVIVGMTDVAVRFLP